MVGFAWTLAAIFRDIIFNGLKYFPIFNLFGRKGSGKTELARALSSLFYVLPATPQSCSNTSIPVIGYNLSHARNSVYILDEYTNELMPQRIDLFKNIWGGTARSKMNEGTPEMIPVNQAVIIAGQYRPEDEALFSRVIHIMYNKTTFTTEEKSAFKTLREMVLHGNTHLLLQILSLREVFEKGYFPAFDLTLNDVLSHVGDAKVEDRILNNWVVALAAFRTLEGHLSVPFSYAELLKVVVDGILYQNDQIRKSSDTANFWTFLDSMHAHGLAKENCHFVIRKCSSFRGTRREQVDFIEPKRIIKLNWKAIRALFDSRFFKQKNTAMLDIATLESYLKSLPQFLGPQVQRFQILRTNGELDETYTSQNGTSTKQMTTTPSNALCFDYDSLQASIDLHLETIRISEEEFNAQLDEVEEPSSPSLTSDPSSLFQKDKDEELPF